jgi:proton glutamate symport protein
MARQHRDHGQPVESASLISLVDRLHYLIRSRLWAQIVLGMVLGVGVGLALSPSGGAWLGDSGAGTLIGWLALPGHLFLALIQMVVVPLVLSSIIVGIASSGDAAFLKRAGLRITPYFIATTTIAVVLGLALSLWIRPGDHLSSGLQQQTPAATVAATDAEAAQESSQSVPELILEVIPTNPTSAVLERSMFQIVILAIFAAVALATIDPKRARPLLDLFGSVQELAMKIVSWAMALAPVAVFGLLAEISYEVGLDAITGMSVYVGTVILGLALVLVMYLTIAWVLGGRNPMRFLSTIRAVQLLAFSTSSSAAVMPLSMQTAEEKLGVRSSIAKFIIPLGATVNMDGTAIYQVIAAVFMTQAFGIDLSSGQLLLLVVTTIGASIGSPSAPGVGIVILATILEDFGVPASGVGLIIGVDRILDMCRTAVNVSGDLTACVVLDRWLPEGPPEPTVGKA